MAGPWSSHGGHSRASAGPWQVMAGPRPGHGTMRRPKRASHDAGKGQRAKGRGQRAKGKGQRAEGRGQRAEGKGQRAKGKGQRAKGKGQRSWLVVLLGCRLVLHLALYFRASQTLKGSETDIQTQRGSNLKGSGTRNAEPERVWKPEHRTLQGSGKRVADPEGV